MPDRPTAAEVVELLGLEPLGAEQITFRRFYASAATAPDGRPLATAIVGLLTEGPDSFSDFHRLPTDELWHFYAGDPIELVLLAADGSDSTTILGTDLRAGEVPYRVVPAGTWMGARLLHGAWALFGTTMTPGFAVTDFEGAEPDDLIARWPHRSDEIVAMTRTGVPRRFAG
ncbi:cupin domain-containing protein [Acidothermaceae bacterium B102]|nr:cupin domain-containing protein [Acidothermaceae bacterium B102]